MTVCCTADAAAVFQWDVHVPSLCQDLALGLQVDFITVFNNKMTPQLGINHVRQESVLSCPFPSYLARINKNNLPVHRGKKRMEEKNRRKTEEKKVDKLMAVIIGFASADLFLWLIYPKEIHERERIINNHKSHTLACGDLPGWKEILSLMIRDYSFLVKGTSSTEQCKIFHLFMDVTGHNTQTTLESLLN